LRTLRDFFAAFAVKGFVFASVFKDFNRQVRKEKRKVRKVAGRDTSTYGPRAKEKLKKQLQQPTAEKPSCTTYA
jgi:hypothetical protein